MSGKSKRILAWILAAAMVLAIMPTAMVAEEVNYEDEYYYDENGYYSVYRERCENCEADEYDEICEDCAVYEDDATCECCEAYDYDELCENCEAAIYEGDDENELALIFPSAEMFSYVVPFSTAFTWEQLVSMGLISLEPQHAGTVASFDVAPTGVTMSGRTQNHEGFGIDIVGLRNLSATPTNAPIVITGSVVHAGGWGPRFDVWDGGAWNGPLNAEGSETSVTIPADSPFSAGTEHRFVINAGEPAPSFTITSITVAGAEILQLNGGGDTGPTLLGARGFFTPAAAANVVFHMSGTGGAGVLSAYNDATISTATGGYSVSVYENNWSGFRIDVAATGASVGDVLQVRGRGTHAGGNYFYWGYEGARPWDGTTFDTSDNITGFNFSRVLQSTDDIIIAANLTGDGANAPGFFFSVDDLLVLTPTGEMCDVCSAPIENCTCEAPPPTEVPAPVFPTPPAGTVVWRLSTDSYVQGLANNAVTELIDTPRLNRSGSPTTAISANSGQPNSIIVRDRVNDWDGIDVILPDLQAGSVYQVVVHGRSLVAPAGATLMLQGMPGHSWMNNTAISTYSVFTRTSTTLTSASDFDAIRITTNDVGAAMSFIIDEIFIVRMGAGQAAGWQAVIDSPLTGTRSASASVSTNPAGILVSDRGTGQHDHNHGLTLNLAGLRALVGNPNAEIRITGILLGAAANAGTSVVDDDRAMVMQSSANSANAEVDTSDGSFEMIITTATANSRPSWAEGGEGFPMLGSPNLGAAGGAHGSYIVTGIYIDGICILTLIDVGGGGEQLPNGGGGNGGGDIVVGGAVGAGTGGHAVSNPGLPPLGPSTRVAQVAQADPQPADDDDNDVAPPPAPGDLHLTLQVDQTFITCRITGERIFMDVTPTIVDGRTLVPVRFIAYALGATVNWNDATRTVSLAHDGNNLSFAIGETAPGMDVPAQIIDGRTMVPLRFISEFFGATVEWCTYTRTVIITK
ncbi:MAG: copper amine oxidase N-terminal domain-containing protein [Defluviitaleaceae bacterium]|nr:copper amine oxidase N-terminal domain-containing protein [Defluviitaleaceae bacterium]